MSQPPLPLPTSLLPTALLKQSGERPEEEDGALGLPVDMRALIGQGLCVLLVLLSTLGPFIAGATSEGASEGSLVRQISYLVVLGGVLVWARPWARGWSLLMVPLPVLAALAWCWISLSWAIAPDIAMRRLLLTTMMVWTTFIIVHTGGYRRASDGLRIALVITLVANYLTVLIEPNVGMHLGSEWEGSALAGNWRGLMTHKNFAGASCAFCMLLFLFDARHVNLRIRAVVLLLAAFFLYRTVSKTSMGMGLLAAMVGFAFSKLNREYRLFIIPVAMLVICAGATYVNGHLDKISTTLAPTAFTGRGQIWEALMLYAKDHVWTGAGFGSFWNVGPTSPIFTYGRGFVTTITVGHNGYLDLLVTVGLPGVLLIVCGVLLWPLAQILSSRRISIEKGSLLCAMVLFCLGHNVTESSLFERDALTGVMAVFVAAFAAYSLPKSRSGRSRRSSGDKSTRQAGKDVMAEMKARARVK
ncbi:O-antigen ligase family protein [Novosphingobium rosa]|uniref:O-antigen ligase family protein n=1 Tax=Novosphingobium rosa TaxID=76978 RepID=UPI00082B992B|nr:O-antigen ligase family protein [Novosphingobium rosa]